MARQEIINESLASSRPKIDQNFSELYTNLANIDMTVAWDEVENKPATFPSTWDEVSGKPTIYPTNWQSVADKPETYPSTWESVFDKPATYPPSAHVHHNYQALLETNLDLLMRGLLYTRAQPFSQSFTFSGDGTRTAFKIPRASVQQQGWVRGGVTATVDGTAASGSYSIHTQTYTLSAAPASGASVIVSAPDVVPYQGVATTADTVEVVYVPFFGLVSTSGTGAAWPGSQNSSLSPLSVKLPISTQTFDDTLLADQTSLYGVSFRNIFWNQSNLLRDDVPLPLPSPRGGERHTLTPFTVAQSTRRGVMAARMDRWAYGSLGSAVPHTSAKLFLVKVVDAASGSPFDSGELLMAVGGTNLTSFEVSTHIFPGVSASFLDFFRLSGGPIVEAS